MQFKPQDEIGNHLSRSGQRSAGDDSSAWQVGGLVGEPHYAIRDLAEMWFQERWKTYYHLVRRWFVHPDGTLEPGVINAGNGKRNRRILVPQSVARRVYERRMRGQIA